jgi:hypothetical protein
VSRLPSTSQTFEYADIEVRVVLDGALLGPNRAHNRHSDGRQIAGPLRPSDLTAVRFIVFYPDLFRPPTLYRRHRDEAEGLVPPDRG